MTLPYTHDPLVRIRKNFYSFIVRSSVSGIEQPDGDCTCFHVGNRKEAMQQAQQLIDRLNENYGAKSKNLKKYNPHPAAER